MRVCSYCGKDNALDQIFCGGCGTRLVAEPEPEPVKVSLEINRLLFAAFAVFLIYLPYIIGFLIFVPNEINLNPLFFLALPGIYIAGILSHQGITAGFEVAAYMTSVLAVALTFIIGLEFSGRPKVARLLFLAAVFIVSAVQATFTLGGMMM
jgi:hypothetical protein